MKKVIKKKARVVGKPTSKTKKRFSLNEKIVIAVCSVIITGSCVAIFARAEISLTAPPTFSNLLVADSTAPVDDPLAAPGKRNCCGTANGKTYGCSDTSFGQDTLCYQTATLTAPSGTIAFPVPDGGAQWRCKCATSSPGAPAFYSNCSARRQPLVVQCGAGSFKTFSGPLPEDNDSLPGRLTSIIGSDLCVNGQQHYYFGVFPDSWPDKRLDGFWMNDCAFVQWWCGNDCTDKNSPEEYNCVVRFCDEKKKNQKGKCGDGFLDPGEDCDPSFLFESRRISFDIFYGKTCANSSAKGPRGELKCTSDCKIDDSGCYPSAQGTQ